MEMLDCTRIMYVVSNPLIFLIIYFIISIIGPLFFRNILFVLSKKFKINIFWLISDNYGAKRQILIIQYYF
jgi:uncharacterized membrane protein